MIEQILSEHGLQDLSIKCMSFAAAVPEQEAACLKSAAEQFRKAGSYISDMSDDNFFWYRQTVTSACNSIRIARLHAKLLAETSDEAAAKRMLDYNALISLD